MMKKRKIIALVLIAVFVCASLVILMLAHHDCCGADCPICLAVSAADRLINVTAAVFAFCAAVLSADGVCLLIFERKSIYADHTLVGLSVKITS